ncbi:MAG: TolC family protein [Balneolaceae bacterium]
MMNNFKLYPAISILLVLLITSNACGQSLDEYQSEAALNNPLLRATYNEYLAELQKAPQVSSLPDPEIAFAYFISPIETRLGPQKTRISATQMFPWFGTLGDRETVSLLNAKAKFEVFQERRNQLFYNLEVLWGEIYKSEEQIRIANENLEIVNTLVNISLIKYETGLVPQIDVLRAQIEQEDIKTNIELLKDNQKLLIKRFNELRNVDPNSKITLPQSLPVEESILIEQEEWIALIRAQNPNLNQLRFKEEAANSNIDNARNNGLPSFGIGLDYIATEERSDIPALTDNGKDAWIARLSIKVPIFRSKYRAQEEEARLQRAATQDRLEARDNQILTDFYTALKDIEDARRRFELFDQKQIQRIEQAVNILLQSYANDNSQFEEILRLERQRFSYELERVIAHTDEFQSMSYLNYLSGAQNITPQEINY